MKIGDEVITAKIKEKEDAKAEFEEAASEGKSASEARVTLSDSGDFAGNRDFILDYRLTGQEINCGLMLRTGEKENFFMLMVQPPERVRAEAIPPREYIFVPDGSGSMFGYPLDTAKELIRSLVGNLRDSDRLNLVLFSDAAASMTPQSVPATMENIRQATAQACVKLCRLPEILRLSHKISPWEGPVPGRTPYRHNLSRHLFRNPRTYRPAEIGMIPQKPSKYGMT